MEKINGKELICLIIVALIIGGVIGFSFNGILHTDDVIDNYHLKNKAERYDNLWDEYIDCNNEVLELRTNLFYCELKLEEK